MSKINKFRCVKNQSFIPECRDLDKVTCVGRFVVVAGVSFELSPLGYNQLCAIYYGSDWSLLLPKLSNCYSAIWLFLGGDFNALFSILAAAKFARNTGNVALWVFLSEFVERNLSIIYGKEKTFGIYC